MAWPPGLLSAMASGKYAGLVGSMKGQPPPGIKIQDNRQKNPTTGLPMTDRFRKSVNADPDVVQQIIAHAKAQGVDPYTALAISYQETGLNKDHPYDLNPDVYGTNYGDPSQGVKSIVSQMQYAKGLQKKGVVPQGEDYLLQGYNGYGTIKKGHADLEGATSIYGLPIPDAGINLKTNPLYGKNVLSLRDEILKTNPAITDLVNKTTAYKPTTPMAMSSLPPGMTY